MVKDLNHYLDTSPTSQLVQDITNNIINSSYHVEMTLKVAMEIFLAISNHFIDKQKLHKIPET